MSDTARDTGIQALKSGDPKGAVQHLGQAVALNPQDGQAHAYLGMAYGQLGMFEKAVEGLQAAVRLTPQSAALRYNLGAALERAGKKAEAVTQYRQALAFDTAYERARQALTRLGEAAPAAAPPGAATVGDFLLGSSPAPPASGGFRPDATIPAGAPPPPSFGPPAGPPGAGGPPGLGGPPGFGGPPGYGPPAGGPPGSQTVADFSPPAGMRPLGDWNAPPPSQPLNWSAPAPGVAPAPGIPAAQAGEPMIATAEAPERSFTRSEQLGHCYLAGMGKGVWWGAYVVLGPIIKAMMFQSATIQSNIGVIIILCLMPFAIGALLYGGIGMLGSSSDDAEQTCGNLGAVVGVLTAAFFMLLFVDFILYLGVPLAIGAVWGSRRLGQALGARINEMNTSVFVVAGPRGLAVTPNR